MFVQHMLSVLRPQGMVATVMPHGVLFRGGDEGEIRTGLLDDDLLDAVIGLGPQLFYGTGIPACILVLRAKGAKPRGASGQGALHQRRPRLTARAVRRTILRPSTSRRSSRPTEPSPTSPASPRVVARAELLDNDDNLNIRRYADNAPPPEPQDVRAHLHRRHPEDARSPPRPTSSPRTASTRCTSSSNGTPNYYDFSNAISSKADLQRLVVADSGVAARK